MKYTKGEWLAIVSKDEILIKDTCCYEPVAQIFHSATCPYRKAMSNARLIACSPELYEIIHELIILPYHIGVTKDGFGIIVLPSDKLRQIRNVLAKIEEK